MIGFDDIDALENIWKLHKSERMNGAVQDVLITQPLLKKLEATRIVLTTRMFDDEYTNCKNELLSRSLQRISIKTKSTNNRYINNSSKLVIYFYVYLKVLRSRNLNMMRHFVSESQFITFKDLFD